MCWELKCFQKTYLNVLAGSFGTGPLKLLKEKSLEHEKQHKYRWVLEEKLEKYFIWSAKGSRRLQKCQLSHIHQRQRNSSCETVIVYPPDQFTPQKNEQKEENIFRYQALALQKAIGTQLVLLYNCICFKKGKYTLGFGYLQVLETFQLS